MLKRKDKLNLIDNYVEIYRCIYESKNAILKEKELSTLENLNKLCEDILSLKKLYENTFEKLKMMDDSLILLRMQLESTLKTQPKNPSRIYSYEFLRNKTNLIEKTLKNII